MAKRRGHGEGSIYERSDGKWVACVDLGYAGGKRQRRIRYARTRAEAVKKLAALQKDISAGVYATSTVTVSAWLDEWADDILTERVATGRLKPYTMRGYRSKIRTYLKPHLGHRRLDRLEPKHVREMYQAMRRDGLAEATIRQTYAILRRALTDAMRSGKVARNVAELTDPPGTQRAKRTGLALADVRKVLATADQTTMPARWWCAVVLGMRQGECLGLSWDNVDLAAKRLTVDRTLVIDGGQVTYGTPKSAAGSRVIDLPPAIVSRLTVEYARADDRHGLVWTSNGDAIRPWADYKAWRALLDAAGVEPVALHAARNTAASLMEQQGIGDREVAQILGQSTVAVTHGYQHAESDTIRRHLGAVQALIETRADDESPADVVDGAPPPA